jgi:hypothetical protein
VASFAERKVSRGFAVTEIGALPMGSPSQIRAGPLSW